MRMHIPIHMAALVVKKIADFGDTDVAFGVGHIYAGKAIQQGH